jgi:hypothetical protein
MPTDTTESKLDTWAIIELMGHQKIAGRLTERSVAGGGFIQVDVPPVGDQPGWSRLISPSAVYAINPVNQEAAVAVAARLQAVPVQPYEMHPPQLSGPGPGPVTDDDDESDEDALGHS